MSEHFGLYVVMTDPVVGYERCAEAAVEVGISYLQLRMKGVGRDEILSTAKALRPITAGTATKLIINDDLEIAMEVDADGVHLGQRDMPIVQARKTWNVPGKIFGLSTHNETQQAEALAIGPDYIGIGPVFPTPTKIIPDPDLGVERLRAMVETTSMLTHVAIGGVTLENLPGLLRCGVRNFCAVRPIMQSEQPADMMRRFIEVAND